MIQLIDQNDVVGTSTYKEFMKSYKYELEPTRKQETILNKILGICRHLYNLGLEQRKDAYENGGWSISYNDQQNQLPELRQKNKEYQEVYTDVLQNALRRLEKAYQRFFERDQNNKKNPDKYKKPGSEI